MVLLGESSRRENGQEKWLGIGRGNDESGKSGGKANCKWTDRVC